ncbi:hypothetical protein [Aquisediminimonas sediminicola]|uniref:hypothetical protein n=1 Tax=Alteraquisediminimonas sediminicola TaxID=2676787 RepID=UPI001C8EE506|nr:hypothetical protein [Aquisediminimonas sediminicola]
MESGKSFNPMAEWQKLVTKWEHQINDFSTKISQREEFSAMMNETSKVSLVAQKQFSEYMDKLLKTMHVPSLSKIGEINDRLDRIEESLDRIAQMLANTGAAAPASKADAPAPARTRKPAKKAS